MSLSPYLYFDGRCEEAFKFYEQCLGGKVTFMMTYEQSHMADKAPPGTEKKILHAGLAFSHGVLEGCDAVPGQYRTPQSFCVMLRPGDPVEAERIFKGLAEQGRVEIPFGETFWAVRFGMVVDRFGIPWLINCEKPSA